MGHSEMMLDLLGHGLFTGGRKGYMLGERDNTANGFYVITLHTWICILKYIEIIQTFY